MHQLRGRLQTFLSNNQLKAYHIIEIKPKGAKKWSLFGDDNGPYKFDSEKERDAKMIALQLQLADQ